MAVTNNVKVSLIKSDQIIPVSTQTMPIYSLINKYIYNYIYKFNAGFDSLCILHTRDWIHRLGC